MLYGHITHTFFTQTKMTHTLSCWRNGFTLLPLSLLQGAESAPVSEPHTSEVCFFRTFITSIQVFLGPLNQKPHSALLHHLHNWLYTVLTQRTCTFICQRSTCPPQGPPCPCFVCSACSGQEMHQAMLQKEHAITELFYMTLFQLGIICIPDFVKGEDDLLPKHTLREANIIKC